MHSLHDRRSRFCADDVAGEHVIAEMDARPHARAIHLGNQIFVFGAISCRNRLTVTSSRSIIHRPLANNDSYALFEWDCDAEVVAHNTHLR